jgi:hypothetical protein
MSRKQLENILGARKEDHSWRIHYTRFVIEPDASDEEKGKAKREQLIAKMARGKNRR